MTTRLSQIKETPDQHCQGTKLTKAENIANILDHPTAASDPEPLSKTTQEIIEEYQPPISTIPVSITKRRIATSSFFNWQTGLKIAGAMVLAAIGVSSILTGVGFFMTLPFFATILCIGMGEFVCFISGALIVDTCIDCYRKDNYQTYSYSYEPIEEKATPVIQN